MSKHFGQMLAMQITRLGELSSSQPAVVKQLVALPQAGPQEVLIRVHACGVCHTELDEIEGRTEPAVLPMTPGHQVVGTVVKEGPACTQNLQGQRVGVAWIHSACGTCKYCMAGTENLCPDFKACGRDAHGGYAEYMTAPEAFVHTIPENISDTEAAPLLCAGAVGFRALTLCRLENGQKLGLTGFGASGHLVLQMARYLYPDSPIYVFARSKTEREFALKLGACWTGNTTDQPESQLDAIIDTTPAWLPVLAALEALCPGGRLVVNAIRKESGDQDVLSRLDYGRHLWMEKNLSTVANVTRQDVRSCLRLAGAIPLHPLVDTYPLEKANDALLAVKQGHIRGAKVLLVNSPQVSGV
jgi:propanol-preferring alcohol dehydrogenase